MGQGTAVFQAAALWLLAVLGARLLLTFGPVVLLFAVPVVFVAMAAMAGPARAAVASVLFVGLALLLERLFSGPAPLLATAGIGVAAAGLWMAAKVVPSLLGRGPRNGEGRGED